MTPAGLGALRKAAVLTHSVSTLGLIVADGDEVRAVVCAHRLDVPASVRQLDPCEFRQAVAWALDEQRAGRPVGVSGFPLHVDPRLRLFALTDCTVRDDGLVRCVTDDGSVVHAFATLLEPPCLQHVGELAGLRRVEPDGGGVMVEFCRDDSVDATLVYTRQDLAAPADESIAVEVLVSLQASAGVEEITSPDHRYLAAS